MGLIERYGENPFLQNAVFQKTLDDVCARHQEDRRNARLNFVLPPTSAHPIATFFSDRARRNAAWMQYKIGKAWNLKRIVETSFYSTNIHRPPNPDYYFEAEAPYAVGYLDHNGAGMSFAWTPLSYMVYHDRYNESSGFYRKIYEGYEVNGIAPSITKEFWTRFFAQGYLIAQGLESKHLQSIIVTCIATDPPADLLPELFWGADAWTTTPEASFALVEAAEDFQYRWNFGEWLHDDERITKKALGRLLNVAP